MPYDRNKKNLRRQRQIDRRKTRHLVRAAKGYLTARVVTFARLYGFELPQPNRPPANDPDDKPLPEAGIVTIIYFP